MRLLKAQPLQKRLGKKAQEKKRRKNSAVGAQPTDDSGVTIF